MKFDPQFHHRHSIRIPGIDYTQAGSYFITMATKNKESLFGEFLNNVMICNNLAAIVQEEWVRTSIIRPGVRLDAFIVMPDHVHGLITILDDGGGLTVKTRMQLQGRDEYELGRGENGQGRGAASPLRNGIFIPVAPPPGSIGAIVGQFKSITTKRINAARLTPGMPVWQRNFYERFIRDEQDYQNTMNYIVNNPNNWGEGKPDW
jgi:REP element-mobilizing transposase RayT